MRVGVVIGLAVAHPFQAEALACARAYCAPTTPIVAIFNGHPCPQAVPIPPGVEVEIHPEHLGQEQGVWRRAYEIAHARGWEWVLIQHDDLRLQAPGWEAALAEGATRWRVATAGFLTSDAVDAQGLSWTGHDGPLRFLIDGAAIAFNMGVFGQRGCFTTLDAACGYGDHEAVYYGMSRGYCSLRLPFPVRHESWATRGPLGLSTGPHHITVAQPYGALLPARVVDDDHVQFKDGPVVDMRRREAADMNAVATPELTDKGPAGHGYTRIYRELFDMPRRLLEIGVYLGGSMRLWRAVWPDCAIHGLDLSLPDLVALDVTLWCGDQCDGALLAEIGRHGPFDVIIDDGGHVPQAQTASLAHLWAAVSPGGWYVIEDVQRAALPNALAAWAPLTGGVEPLHIWSTDPPQVAVAYRKPEAA